MVPSGDLLTSASDSKENPCGTLPSILPDHGRRCHTVSTGDKQGISVAVQIVANDLQPNLVTANQAGIDYQSPGSRASGTIEGSQARPFAGVNCFYVASNGKNKAFAETFVAERGQGI